MKRILFYCQHLVGIGHLVRSSAISQALAKDFSVLFVSGGPPVNDFRLPENIQTLQLPAIESDPEFQNIRASDPSSTLEETKERRKKILLDLIDSFEPGMLITELFPFGRKQFHFELLPLLEKARSRSGDTVIACSVRDLLVRKNDSHE